MLINFAWKRILKHDESEMIHTSVCHDWALGIRTDA